MRNTTLLTKYSSVGNVTRLFKHLKYKTKSFLTYEVQAALSLLLQGALEMISEANNIGYTFGKLLLYFFNDIYML